MKLTSIGTVIAKRVLTRSGKRKVIVEIGKPRRFRGGAPDYYCPFRIRGLGKDFISAGAGVDAVQALELAFVAIGSRLYFSPQGKAGELTWDAGEVPGDLGFPLMEIAEDESMIPERVMHLYLRR
ncbi:MAG TPA: hypothetical protein VE397_04970, partial [Stellaceae bacterium]|nr:hypothetical protein [Stellaceae bacterium]